MRKTTLVLGLSAIVGIGSAFTTTSQSGDTPNVRNTAAAGETPVWISVDPEDPGTCTGPSSRDCFGYQATPSSPVTTLEYGAYSN